MRRAIVALVSTIVGLVLLLGFKSHSSAGTGLVATAPHHPAKAKAAPTPKPKSSPATKKRSTSTVTSTRTVTGDSVDTSYGPVQVRVSVKGSRITDVQAVQLPQGSSRDIEIDNSAVPQLRQEALDAQSAQINSISGATYTSDGYIRSLQSALDSAGI